MKVLHGSERFLLTVGVICVLVYLCTRIYPTAMYQASQWSFSQLTSGLPTVAYEEHGRTVDFSLWAGNRIKAYKQALASRIGVPFAVLSIPRLRLDVPVFEGTDELTLNRGAGRIVGTARPGERGNIGIAAHRDGFFRGLKEVRPGDRIELAQLRRKFVYTVDNIAVVDPRRCNGAPRATSTIADPGDLLSVLFHWRRTATLHRASVSSEFRTSEFRN